MLGGPNDSKAKNLAACYGECDADSQCSKGLKCFQRTGTQHIPGCNGAGVNGWDYCYVPKTAGNNNNGGSHGNVLGGTNDSKAKNLNACWGECDADAQCATGLKCFQRGGSQHIPGCNGAGKIGWDYCYDPNTGGVIALGGPNNSNAKDLGRCYGECDKDSHCAHGLKCFQRSNGEAIPGCKGAGGGKNWDYCYDPNWNELFAGDKTLGGPNDGKAKNLKACWGECDNDAQCATGLKCFQREKGEKIPGCKGPGGGKNWDYCYDPKKSKKGGRQLRGDYK
jgi:hypothetical protein